jgi:hypothetical protein
MIGKRGVVLLMMVWAMASCKHSGNSLKPSHPDMIQVKVTESGGVTGMTRGWTLVPPQDVMVWHQFPGASVDTLSSFQLDPALMQKWIETLWNTGFDSLHSQTVGNMTTRIAVTIPDTMLVRSWSGDISSGEIPLSLREWLGKLDSLFSENRTESTEW